MTRYLSSLLGAAEPVFGQSIAQLEQASGHPSADIHLSSEVMHQARQKIALLGLDPDDTTGPELYRALQERLRRDEQELREALLLAPDASPGQIIQASQQFLDTHESPRTCFALKASVAKRLLKKKIPKNAMKQLGYRSLDSMLKHEPVAYIYAAALITESATWHRGFREQYAKLQPRDFEQRRISVMTPKAERWLQLAAQFTASTRHTIISFKELGTIVLLPTTTSLPGLTLVTILLSLASMNDIRAYSSFTKLQQVRPNFGQIVQRTSLGEPFTSAVLAGRPVSWRVIQRFYARHNTMQRPGFEPHIQPEDLTWHTPEAVLAKLRPSLAFWQDAMFTATLHDGDPVSFNVIDVALGFCNQLGFADRIIHFLRDNLWHELMMRYLHQGNLEEALQRQLTRELVDEVS